MHTLVKHYTLYPSGNITFKFICYSKCEHCSQLTSHRQKLSVALTPKWDL